MHLIMYYVFAYIYMYARTQSRKPTQEHEFIDILNPFGIQTQYTVHGRYLILILIHLRADHIPVHIHIPHIRSCVAHHIRTHRIWYECMIVDDEHLGANTPTTKYIHIDVWHINVRRAPWYVDVVDWQQNRMICYCYMLNRLHKCKRCVIAVLRFTSHRSHTTNRYTLQSNSQHIHLLCATIWLSSSSFLRNDISCSIHTSYSCATAGGRFCGFAISLAANSVCSTQKLLRILV